MRHEVDKQTAIAALEAALHNYRIDRVGPYTLAIISQGDLAILEGKLAGLQADYESRMEELRDMDARYKAAQEYIVVLEGCTDGYYRATESDEAKRYHAFEAI